MLGRRPDVGVGGAHDIGPLRAPCPARRPPIGQRTAGNHRNARRCRAPGRSAARRAAGTAARAGPLDQAAARLRARLEQSIDPAGELLDGASPALGGLRRAVRLAYERLRSEARDHRPRRGDRDRAPGAHRHRCATAATSSLCAPTRAAGSRASSTISRAAARRCSSSRSWWSSWATPGARRSSRSRRKRNASSTSCPSRSCAQADALDETLGRPGHASTSGAGPGAAGRRHGRRPPGNDRRRRRSSCCQRATRG